MTTTTSRPARAATLANSCSSVVLPMPPGLTTCNTANGGSAAASARANRSTSAPRPTKRARRAASIRSANRGPPSERGWPRSFIQLGQQLPRQGRGPPFSRLPGRALALCLTSTVTLLARLRGLSTSVPRAHRGVIRQQLQRHDVQDRREHAVVLGHADHAHALAGLDARVGIGEHEQLAAARPHFLQVALELFQQRVVRRDRHHRHLARVTSASGPCFSSPAG